MGGAADFKVGYKTGFASGAREKFVPWEALGVVEPPLFQMWGYKRSRHINELRKKKQESN